MREQANKWRALPALLGGRRAAGDWAMVVGAGMACGLKASGEAFIWYVWLTCVFTTGMLWLCASVLSSRDAAALRVRLHQIALALAPLSLLFLLPLVHRASLWGATFLVHQLVVGLMAAIVAQQWLPVGRDGARLRRIAAHPATSWALVTVWSATVGYMVLIRWWNLAQATADVSLYEQSLANTFRGHFMQTTFGTPVGWEMLSRFGDHFEAILICFLPFYALWHSPVWLLLGQTITIGSAAVPIVALTRRWSGSAVAGLVLAGAYLCHPGIQAGVFDDVHPSALGGPLALWGLWLALSGRPALSLLFFVPAMGAKENLPGVVFMCGLFIAWKSNRRFGLALATLALFWEIMAMKVIIPHFTAWDGYRWRDCVGVLEPGQLSRGVVGFAVRRLDYLLQMSVPMAGLCFLAPGALAIAATEMFVHFTSSSQWMLLLAYHYHIEILTGMMAASAAGFAWVRHTAVRRGGAAGPAAGRAVTIGLTAAVLYGLLTGPSLVRDFPWDFWRLPSPEANRVHALLARIPPEAAILTNDGTTANYFGEHEWLMCDPLPGSVDASIVRDLAQANYAVLTLTGVNDEWVRQFCRNHRLRLVGHESVYWVFEVLPGPGRPARRAGG
ncbi:MAG: DUF2079 domain-containing protein [Armatimonadetes bacterium]|nr:DUF2079 domain-containing protein [Armatimonadota bacterium]